MEMITNILLKLLSIVGLEVRTNYCSYSRIFRVTYTFIPLLPHLLVPQISNGPSRLVTVKLTLISYLIRKYPINVPHPYEQYIIFHAAIVTLSSI